MGNPPFVGAGLMSSRQKKEVLSVFGEKWKKLVIWIMFAVGTKKQQNL